jgi:hypothetical protein
MNHHPRRRLKSTLLLAPALAALLTGCGGARATALPFSGTWHLARAATAGATDPAEGDAQGWVAIAPDQVTADVPGLPRGSAAVVASSADPAHGSACLDLDNGLRLFLSAGHGAGEYAVPGGRLLGPADWLDVHAVRGKDPAAEEVARLRLWTQDSLTTAARATQLRRAPAPQAPAAAAPGAAPRPASASAAAGAPVAVGAMRPPADPRSPAELRLELLRALEAARHGGPTALEAAQSLENRLLLADQGR